MDSSSAEQVIVQIVLHNSLQRHGAVSLRNCFQAAAAQEGYKVGCNYKVVVWDNGSADGTAEFLRAELPEAFILRRNLSNLGFCGAHNQGVRDFLDSAAEYLLLLNPDLALDPAAVTELVAALKRHPEAGTATPKLLRADENLRPLTPPVLDAAGMSLFPSLRHLDRGSGQCDNAQFAEEKFVFGGTGACLLMRRAFVKDCLLSAGLREKDKVVVCELLGEDPQERALLFDEAFFAYREDADLAWRDQILGWKCIYAPKAIGYHRRIVVPENRAALPAELNLMGVRNRFLLQLNNLPARPALAVIIQGLLIRNLIVLFGVLLFERTSLPALRQMLLLWPRGRERRRILYARARISMQQLRSCFVEGRE